MPRRVTPSGDDHVALSYAAILKQVPKELYGNLAPAGAAGSQFKVSRAQVVEQLPLGAVKVSFGLLRQHAPAGVFVSSSAYDSRLIDLPLSEILSQMEPKAFARRPSQRVVEAPPEVTAIFGSKGERISDVGAAEKSRSAKTTAVNRQIVTVAPAPLAQPVKPATAPAQRPASPVPLAGPSVAPIASTKAAAPPLPASVKPTAGSKPVAPLPKAAAALPKSKPLPATPPSMPNVDPGVFFLALAEVADCWPEPVRQELAQLALPNAKCAFSAAEMCEGLKRGKVQYPWKQVRAWIQEAPSPDAPSPYGDTILEFPLNIITPLFLEFIRSTPSQRKVGSAEHITEFFRKAHESAPNLSDSDEPDLPSVSYQKTVTPPTLAVPVTPTPPPSPVPTVPPVAPVAITHAPVARTDATTEPAPARNEPISFDHEGGLLRIPLSILSAGWPEPILEESSYFGLTQRSVNLPLDAIESGLKLGRVDHSWSEVCSWIPECPPAAFESSNAQTRLALPLNIIAPLYFKHRPNPNAPTKQPPAALKNIPDLFSVQGAPLPVPPSPPRTPPAPMPVAPAAPAPAPTLQPAAVKSPPRNLAELFGEPEKRNWSPNDIVQASSRLPGVTGALIALQDGLLVASCMPETGNTETIAAFLPQMFGRMNQYSKELQLGDVRSLSLGVTGGTLQIFKASIIYFAVLGRPDAPLPMTELIFIAGELDRQST